MSAVRYMSGSLKFREVFICKSRSAPISLLPGSGFCRGTPRILRAPRVGLSGTVACPVPKPGDSTSSLPVGFCRSCVCLSVHNILYVWSLLSAGMLLVGSLLLLLPLAVSGKPCSVVECEK